MKISFAKRGNPENKEGMKINYAPAKRKVSKAAWWLILIIVFAPFLWLLVSLGAKWFFVSSSGAVAMDSYPVMAVEGGIVTKIYVKQGEFVDAGSPLVEMRRNVSVAYGTELKRVKAELEALSKTGGVVPPRRSLSHLDGMMVHLANEERVMRDLMEKGAATRAEYNQAKERLLAARNDRDALLNTLTAPRDNSVETRKAYLQRYADMLAENISTPLTLYAPRAGRVEYISVTPGYEIAGEQELMRITDPKDPYVIAYVFPENYDERVRTGKVVKVHLPGSGRTIDAAVVDTPLNANSVPGGLSDTILSGRRGIVVFLKPDGSLLAEESVNGMPVRVDWGIRFFR